jgi:hypothetical protein
MLLSTTIPDTSILHIQIFDSSRSACISLSDSSSADKVLHALDGFNWEGYVLTTSPDQDYQEEYIPQASFMSPPDTYYPGSPMDIGDTLPPMNGPHVIQPPISTPLPSPFPPPMMNQSVMSTPLMNESLMNQGMNPPMMNPGMNLPLMNPQMRLRMPSAPGYGYYFYNPYFDPSSFSPHPSGTSLVLQSDPSSEQTSPIIPYKVKLHDQSPQPHVSLRQLGNLHQYDYHSITDIDSRFPDKRRLFIGNIPYSTEWMDLKDFLRQAGNIQRVEIPSDATGMSRGFAIATFETDREAERAITEFDGASFQGRYLTVRWDRFIKRSSEVSIAKYSMDEKENVSTKDTTPKQDSQEPVEKSQDDIDDKRFEDEARNLIESLSIK